MPHLFWSNFLGSELANLRALCRCLNGEIPHNPNWVAIVSLANRTLTTPSLANRLLGDDRLPADLAKFLQAIKARSLLRNQAMFAQLTEAVDALASRGVKPILVRGASFIALGGKAYDNRVFGDLDLLVPVERADEAFESLEAIGYRRFGPSASRRDGQKLCRETDAGGIDLRCMLRLPQPGLNFADLVPECREITMGNGSVWLPSPTIQALAFIMHDQLQEKDYWRGLIDLRHLYDLKLVLETQGGMEWGKLIGLFPAGHARRALHTQLLTLDELFDVPIPLASRRSMAARIQLSRRLVQMRFKWLAPFCTLLMVLVDPPLAPFSKTHAQAIRGIVSSPFVARLRVLRRLFLAPKQTKV